MVMRTKIVQSYLGTLEMSLSRSHPIRFWAGQEAENEFEVPRDHLRHRILDLNQVAFSGGEEANYEFAMPGDQLKHRFINFKEVAF